MRVFSEAPRKRKLLLHLLLTLIIYEPPLLEGNQTVCMWVRVGRSKPSQLWAPSETAVREKGLLPIQAALPALLEVHLKGRRSLVPLW